MMLNAVWSRLNILRTNIVAHGKLRTAFHCNVTELEEEVLPPEWYKIVYAKLIRLSSLLKDFEHIDGKLISADDNSIINDVHCISQMQNFISLARVFIRSPSSHLVLKESSSCCQTFVGSCFSSLKRRALTLDSLTEVCNFLGISAQQRKSVRLAVCPQVTQHHIWRGALEKVLEDLKCEMDNLGCRSSAFQMAKQVIVSCLMFLEDTTRLQESEHPAWMRPTPLKKVDQPTPPRKWEEVLEMFVHLSRCMSQEERLVYHYAKIEVMKEGLYQIKDIVIERDIAFKEARRQDSLVQKNLTKSLGHSSKCLFTLLLYYLYGTVRDIEVEISGGICGAGGQFYLHVGKILTSDNEGMVRNGIKQLYRALGVFKFVWETASMDGTIKFQGHLWSVGANERTLTYRENEFFVHNIRKREMLSCRVVYAPFGF